MTQKLITIVSLLSAIFVCQAANASENIRNDTLQKEFEARFEKMINNPSDSEIAMQYIKLAIELKDYEAAIPPLENMLHKKPNSAEIKQELGVLYYQINAFDIAKAYLEEAKKGDNVPGDIIEKADSYLVKLN